MEARNFQGSWLCVGDWPAPGGRAPLAFLRVSAAPAASASVSASLGWSKSINICSPKVLRLRVNCTASEQLQQQEEELPEKLREIVGLFATVPDQRAKYEQLMFYAKKLPPLAPEFHTKENKVVGCVSQVWVTARLSDNKVFYEADSDSILTKGLAALLVEGLSGSSVRDIVRLTPDFIQMLGLRQSLTPARTSGFYNMFRLMQKKALQLELESSLSTTSSQEAAISTLAEGKADDSSSPAAVVPETMKVESSSPAPRFMSIQKKLQEALAPSVLEVVDVSHQHAGHAAVRGTSGGETHFNVNVVSAEFEGRSLIKRHRLVYDLLDEELKSGLHALSIVAKAPSELK